jgi:hypothetical protein
MDSPIASRIKNFVSEGRTSDALALLLEASLPNKQVHDAVHQVLGEFNDLTSNRLRGTIDDTEATLRLNIIHNKILIALNSFDSEGKPLPGNVVADLGPTGNILLRGGLLLFVGSILLVLLGLVLKIMSLNGASEVIVTGFCLGLGGLFLLGCWLLSRLSNPLKGR